MANTYLDSDRTSRIMANLLIVVFLLFAGFLLIVDNASAVNLSLREKAAETIVPLNETAYNILIGALGGNTTYDNTSTGIGWKVLFIDVPLLTYTDVLGNLALVIVISIPFLMMWIMQRDMSLVGGCVGAVVGLFLIPRIPANWQVAAVWLIAISLVSILYGLLTRGRG